MQFLQNRVYLLRIAGSARNVKSDWFNFKRRRVTNDRRLNLSCEPMSL